MSPLLKDSMLSHYSHHHTKHLLHLPLQNTTPVKLCLALTTNKHTSQTDFCWEHWLPLTSSLMADPILPFPLSHTVNHGLDKYVTVRRQGWREEWLCQPKLLLTTGHWSITVLVLKCKKETVFWTHGWPSNLGTNKKKNTHRKGLQKPSETRENRDLLGFGLKALTRVTTQVGYSKQPQGGIPSTGISAHRAPL